MFTVRGEDKALLFPSLFNTAGEVLILSRQSPFFHYNIICHPPRSRLGSFFQNLVFLLASLGRTSFWVLLFRGAKLPLTLPAAGKVYDGDNKVDNWVKFYEG